MARGLVEVRRFEHYPAERMGAEKAYRFIHMLAMKPIFGLNAEHDKAKFLYSMATS